MYILSLLLFCCYRAANVKSNTSNKDFFVAPSLRSSTVLVNTKTVWLRCLVYFSSQRRKHQSQRRKLYCIRRDRRSEAEALSNTCNRSLQAISRFLQFFSFTCWRVCSRPEAEHWTCTTMCRTESWILTSVAFNNT